MNKFKDLFNREEIPEETKEEKEEVKEEIPEKFKTVDLEGHSIEEMLQYEAETEKHAIWGNKITKQFKDWKDAR